MNRGIALLGLVVVRTTATRFLRGLAEHSPANVTNYTRCVFQRVKKVKCYDTYGEKLWSKDEAFALCDADPECDAVQKWKKNIGSDVTRYKLCSLGKDACGRARLKKHRRRSCGDRGHDHREGCSIYHVFTCLPYDEAPGKRSGGLFALCILMLAENGISLCFGSWMLHGVAVTPLIRSRSHFSGSGTLRIVLANLKRPSENNLY